MNFWYITLTLWPFKGLLQQAQKSVISWIRLGGVFFATKSSVNAINYLQLTKLKLKAFKSMVSTSKETIKYEQVAYIWLAQSSLKKESVVKIKTKITVETNIRYKKQLGWRQAWMQRNSHNMIVTLFYIDIHC